ncbi:MAG: MarR family winged helix-turn-helix transcriptional regulator [Burkholderiaceae bacterium]|nr:MarR family winged helix-turn-helix transcriptional regulator [Burkholderiaceae bacterium]
MEEFTTSSAEPRQTNLEARVWLRMLGCANLIENELRELLRTGFDSTLARFDVLAQLARPPEEPTMGELSQRLMVTKGSITDVIGRLEAAKLVERRRDDDDARVQRVRLTPRGRRLAAEMIPAHNERLAEVLGEFGRADLKKLDDLLGRLRSVLRDGRASRTRRVA